MAIPGHQGLQVHTGSPLCATYQPNVETRVPEHSIQHLCLGSSAHIVPASNTTGVINYLRNKHFPVPDHMLFTFQTSDCVIYRIMPFCLVYSHPEQRYRYQQSHEKDIKAPWLLIINNWQDFWNKWVNCCQELYGTSEVCTQVRSQMCLTL